MAEILAMVCFEWSPDEPCWVMALAVSHEANGLSVLQGTSGVVGSQSSTMLTKMSINGRGDKGLVLSNSPCSMGR